MRDHASPNQLLVLGNLENMNAKSELHSQKREQLQDIIRTILHELMPAKTRVHGSALDFDSPT